MGVIAPFVRIVGRARWAVLATALGQGGCHDAEGREPTGATWSPTSGGTSQGESSGPDETVAGTTTTMPTATAEPDPSSASLDDSGGSTGGPSGEPFSMSDPLIDGTMGSAVGGSFGPDGWTTTDRTDRIYWALPRLAEGSFEFTVTGLTVELMPLNDHEIFAMYEGGWGIEHPIAYNPEFRVNNYKSMIRIYGQAEPDRVGQQKIMWGMCPHGAPGYTDACPCAGAFFEEPFGGDGSWDGTPQRLRVEWGGGYTRYLRNDAVVLEIDWTQAGVAFGPEELYVSIGTPRPEDVGSASMPIGALFYDVVIEGVTGPAASCM